MNRVHWLLVVKFCINCFGPSLKETDQQKGCKSFEKMRGGLADNRAISADVSQIPGGVTPGCPEVHSAGRYKLCLHEQMKCEVGASWWSTWMAIEYPKRKKKGILSSHQVYRLLHSEVPHCASWLGMLVSAANFLLGDWNNDRVSLQKILWYPFL